MDFEITMEEARVLGALIEKHLATPEYYPMTLNGLKAACNQKTGRDPVVSYDEDTIMDALDGLRDKGLALRVTEGGGRVPKHRHNAVDALGLDRPRMAAFALLLLRGSQTLGEIRTRAGRMHEFGDLAETEGTLEKMIRRENGALVKRLERQAGQKEARFAHLLFGERAIPAATESISQDAAPGASRLNELEREVTALRDEVADLRKIVNEMREAFM